jgi:hypothetical protein
VTKFYGTSGFKNFNSDMLHETVELEQSTRTCNRMLRYNINYFIFNLIMYELLINVREETDLTETACTVR